MNKVSGVVNEVEVVEETPEEEKIFTVKNGIHFLVTIGVGTVIDDIIAAVAPKEIRLPAKILRKIGSWALGWCVGDIVGDHVLDSYEGVKEMAKDVSKRVIEAYDKYEKEEAAKAAKPEEA